MMVKEKARIERAKQKLDQIAEIFKQADEKNPQAVSEEQGRLADEQFRVGAKRENGDGVDDGSASARDKVAARLFSGCSEVLS